MKNQNEIRYRAFLDDEYVRGEKDAADTNGRGSVIPGRKKGKYKGTLQENDKEKANALPKPVTITALIGTGIGIIISLITQMVAITVICIFISFFVGLIINAIIKKKSNKLN